MYRFSDKAYFANGVLINMLFQIPVLFFSLWFFTCQLHHYATSTNQPHHYSSTSSLPITLDFLSFSSLESSDSFPLVSKFLATSCLSLDAVNAGYHVYN